MHWLKCYLDRNRLILLATSFSVGTGLLPCIKMVALCTLAGLFCSSTSIPSSVQSAYPRVERGIFKGKQSSCAIQVASK